MLCTGMSQFRYCVSSMFKSHLDAGLCHPALAGAGVFDHDERVLASPGQLHLLLFVLGLKPQLVQLNQSAIYSIEFTIRGIEKCLSIKCVDKH